ncbi:MAG TPA: type I-E CRISPR-associated protein Cas6/Cse3/CasE [Methanocorpusculum sp.]|nr:type I-E CRISPR-associated protein Cas6/Cse3/CasE [Methanocorpusculum sp.]HJK84039.1 type I-E CRISPR-associated protein Cas6/Cse3/CasE [Methanocorpusculum sp.]
MYFSRAMLRSDCSGNVMFFDSVRSTYAVHQMVWGFFHGQPEEERKFLYRFETKNHEPVVYIVSEEKPIDVRGVWSVLSKMYDPVISNGEQLGFSVRVNPVVTRIERDTTGNVVRHSRHDVVMDEKIRCRREGTPFVYAEKVQEVGKHWLATRAKKSGFHVDGSTVLVSGYEKQVFERQRGKEVVISTMELSGVLEVCDPDLFRYMLFHGLGPAKGFGCGLMMVRRV